MRVLLTGANGFIGAHLTAALLGTGHNVVGAVRYPGAFLRRFPACEAVRADLNRDLKIEDWLPRLKGIDAVINCAGILQSERGQSAQAIHYQAPAALFDACAQAHVSRVIQISAISADRAADTEYALTKLMADDHLRALDVDWIVLRPSLVYAQGSHGGTSLLRALAAMPGFIPVVAKGDQLFQPIYIDDLAATVLRCLSPSLPARQTINPVGPGTLTLTDILIKLRGWLGLKPAKIILIPINMIRFACRIGDIFNAGPLRTTSLKQIEYGNAGDPAAFISAIGFTPRPMDIALAQHPAQTQDRWHTQLYLLRPLITLILSTLWLASGIIGLFTGLPRIDEVLGNLAFSPALSSAVKMGSSALDLLIGVSILLAQRRSLLGLTQLIVISGYTVFLTMAAPGLWLDPFGPLLKNLPIMVLIMVWMIVSEER